VGEVSDLAAFLLARIAEDEEAADRASQFSTRNGFAWVGPTPERATVLALSGHRLLAECEAKRRIVATIQRWLDTGYPTLDHVFFALALPYADHPEYRAEWRP
jgi:hypothetical protein